MINDLPAKLASSFPTEQLPFANRHNQRIDPVIVQGTIKHRLQCRLVIDRVVCYKDAALNHARHDLLITLRVNLFLAVEETKTDIVVTGQVVQGVTTNKLDDIANARGVERRPRQLSLLVQNVESGNFSVPRPAS